MMYPIMTRRQAAEAGAKRYYTGRPCSKGHDAQRFTTTGVCVRCAAAYVSEYNARLRKGCAGSRAGLFSYPAHPDDVAALLAYAQALDLQRGRPPHVPEGPTTSPDVGEARRLALGRAGEFAPPSPPAYIPKP